MPIYTRGLAHSIVDENDARPSTRTPGGPRGAEWLCPNTPSPGMLAIDAIARALLVRIANGSAVPNDAELATIEHAIWIAVESFDGPVVNILRRAYRARLPEGDPNKANGPRVTTERTLRRIAHLRRKKAYKQAAWVEAGLCERCGGEREDARYRNCDSCRKAASTREAYRKGTKKTAR